MKTVVACIKNILMDLFPLCQGARGVQGNSFYNFIRPGAGKRGGAAGRGQGENSGEQIGHGFTVPAPGNGFSKYSE